MNGYFIVAEYLVHQAARGSSHRTATDLGVAAYRPPARRGEPPGVGVRAASADAVRAASVRVA